MLSDEEKKAIEFIKSELQDEKKARNDYQSLTGLYGNLEIEIILNIIEKQSKEIEELKQKDKKYTIHFTQKQYNDAIKLAQGVESGKWKDKIKAKIEELDKEIKVKREISKNPMDRVAGRLLTDSIVELEKTKKVLQSLLEKE